MTIQLSFLASQIPGVIAEHQFAPPRRWRFDYAWPGPRVALEVQGGIWTAGRHVRGAALLKEWEKLNEAAAMGFRIIYCQPKDLMTGETIDLIRRAIQTI